MLRRVSLVLAAALLFAVTQLAAQDQAAACSAVQSSKTGYWAAFDLADMPSD